MRPLICWWIETQYASKALWGDRIYVTILWDYSWTDSKPTLKQDMQSANSYCVHHGPRAGQPS